jgi:hypothetical protein
MYENVILSRPFLKTHKMWEIYGKLFKREQSFDNIPFLLFSVNLMFPLGDRIKEAVGYENPFNRSKGMILIDDKLAVGFIQRSIRKKYGIYYIGTSHTRSIEMRPVFFKMIMAHLHGGYKIAHMFSDFYEWAKLEKIFDIEEVSVCPCTFDEHYHD